jgi:hypothetical protein
MMKERDLQHRMSFLVNNMDLETLSSIFARIRWWKPHAMF